jgi:uncharacterized protein (DUF1800 family)
MQIYLNNRSSRAGNANENYGRELFELHTLGRDHYYNAVYDKWRKVPGSQSGKPIGYIDQDVYEAARAFTGWTIEDGCNGRDRGKFCRRPVNSPMSNPGTIITKSGCWRRSSTRSRRR